MKAKDYAEQFFKDEQTMSDIDCTSKVFAGFVTEIETISKTRNVSTTDGMLSIIKEQDQKWKAFCRIINKDQPRFKEDGFLALLVKEMPWLGTMLEERVNEMLKGEKLLWWELDKIAVRESNPGMNMKKAEAAENMMKFLEHPTHEECRRQYQIDCNQ